VRIKRAFETGLNERRSTADIEDMTESASQSSPFEENCLAVLDCYAVKDAAAKAGAAEYSGWLDRIQDVPGIETLSLTTIHGFLIAQGLIKFEFNGRSVGLQYQISTQGRESITRKSVYLSDDPRGHEGGNSDSDVESVSHAA
ncbi:MAG TPA: hypothetical protein PLY87_29605, partial [Planctomycetaceae bacterium]|nr:hypothetical protein [Planctomycetaceae bacterium]